jgi:hypothetical protein
MPTRSVEPKAFVFANKSSQAITIATLRFNIQAGKKIWRSDINSIVGLLNDMLGHYHTYEDRIQNREIFNEYGQTPGARDATVYVADRNTAPGTGVVVAFPGALGAISAGSVIQAAAVNVGLNALRAMGVHTHNISDQTAL